jgi:hypothetical protein
MDLMDLMADGQAGLMESHRPRFPPTLFQILYNPGGKMNSIREVGSSARALTHPDSFGYGAVDFLSTHQHNLVSIVDAFYSALPVRKWNFPASASATRNHFSEFKQFSNPDGQEVVEDFIDTLLNQYRAFYHKGGYNHHQYFGNRSVAAACKVLRDYLSSYSFVTGVITLVQRRQFTTLVFYDVMPSLKNLRFN